MWMNKGHECKTKTQGFLWASCVKQSCCSASITDLDQPAARHKSARLTTILRASPLTETCLLRRASVYKASRAVNNSLASLNHNRLWHHRKRNCCCDAMEESFHLFPACVQSVLHSSTQTQSCLVTLSRLTAVKEKWEKKTGAARARCVFTERNGPCYGRPSGNSVSSAAWELLLRSGEENRVRAIKCF